MSNNLGNKETMAKNIVRYMERDGYTRPEMCEILKVPYSTFTDWIKGRSYPRIDKIQKMANLFGISKADLVEEEHQKADNFITYPVVVGIKAGFDGEIVFEESGDSEQIPTEWIRGDTPDKFFVAKVHGDSMYPMFLDGDRVLVRVTPSVDSGSICAIKINGNEITLKRVVYKQGEDWLELQPINTAYPPKRIEGRDRIIPIHPRIQKYIKRHYDSSQTKLIEHDGKPYSTRYYRKCYYRVLDELNVKKISPHKARHTFFSLMDKYCKDKKAMADVGGHTDYKFTESVYVHPDLERLRTAIESMP